MSSTKRTKSQLRPAILGPLRLEAEAAIYITDDQFLFHGVDDSGVEQIKFISGASLRNAFAKEPLDSGWLPQGVIRYGISSRGTWMVRWHEPATYTIRLEDRARPIRVPMPSLIWVGIKNNYYIFAAVEKEFKPNACLYRAPLSNVNHHGLICFGNNDHPDVAIGGFDKAWKAFWASEFNNHHDDGKSKMFKTAVNNHLLKLAREKATSYPMNDLVSMITTLEAVIKQLTKRGADADVFGE